MGGGKLPPRQKMIGMMYLVLTALLAMNVSKDILDAFILINDSLEATNRNFTAKNDVAYNAFQKAYLENPTKVKRYYDKAQGVKRNSKELFEYIDSLKFYLIRHTDQKIDKNDFPDDTIRLAYAAAKDNYDTPTHILIGDEPATPIKGPHSAVELKEKIASFREYLTGVIEKKDRAGMKIGLKTDSVKEWDGIKGWEDANFYHLPLAAVVTNLTKIQTDIKNAEADVVKQLFSAVDASDFNFDIIKARVIPKSNYVFMGEDYEAEIFVAAYSSTQNPEMAIGDVDTSTNTFRGGGKGDTIPVHNGVGIYKVRGSAEGEKKYAGMVRIKAPDGTFKPYTFDSKYMVAKPSAVVSLDKMNVFYLDVDNPVTISAGGIAAERLTPSMSGGSILATSMKEGKYAVRVSAGSKEATINVAAKSDDGKGSKPMGAFKYRVKPIPPPRARFAGKEGSAKISKNDLVNAGGAIANMGEDFLFELSFDVTGFCVAAVIGGFEQRECSSSNKITEKQKKLLQGVKTGNKVIIEEVKARLKGSSTAKEKTLDPIVLTVN